MWIKFFLIVILMPMSLCLTGQDTISEDLKTGFANYLFNLKQYEFAAEEYERILFDDPENIDVLGKLIRSYRLSGKAEYLKIL